MKKILTFFAAAAMLTAAATAQVSADVAEKCYKILEAADELSPKKGDYSFTQTEIIEKPGKPKENVQYKVFGRVVKGKASMGTAVQIFPEADKGHGLLLVDDHVWEYDSVSRKFTHKTLKEKIGNSNTSIGDMLEDDDKWRVNYDVDAYEDGMLGKIPVDIITLKAKTSEPEFSKERYYIRKDIPLCLKKEGLTSSGRLMQTILLPKYTKVPNGYLAVQGLYRDELNKGEQTQVVVSDLTFDTIPDKVFTKAYLEGLN
ncbi:MAG: outer membrane lipoprotein-sorting protein [Treponema sp.]|nr:outer membrane lipoprotein-sorting protein [Treponema sp.]